MTMALSERLLDKLACPQCHDSLGYDEDNDSLICNCCKLRFRVIDDIPVLLLDQAEEFRMKV